MRNKEKILIVDDHPRNLKMATLALEEGDFEVFTAPDGEAALMMLREFRPDLILLDMQLPGMDGLEFAHRLKADSATGDIIVVALTAHAMKKDRREAISAGLDGYITKPIDLIDLPQQVGAYFGRSRTCDVPGLPPEAARIRNSLASEPGPNSERPYILLVEDNPTTRKMFKVTLEGAGYDVAEAGDGKTALELVAQRRPDLIVQDLILPDVDGLEMVRRLRELLGDTPTPIIYVSGLLTRMDDAKAMKDDFAHVLVKPVDPSHLLDIVKVHLDLPPVAPGKIGEGLLLLVVDDDPLYHQLSQVWCSALGFNVLAADNATAAMAVARRARPALIVSEILMPTMDGFEFCLAIRQDPELAKIPMILNSASYVEDADRALATRVGASAMLCKTGNLHAIAEAIVKALEAPAPAVSQHAAQIIKEEHTQRTVVQLERQVLQNSRLLRRSRLLETELMILAGVADALGEGVPISEVLADVLTACLDMAGISKGALYLSEDGALELETHIGFATAEVASLREFMGTGTYLNEVANSGRVISLPSPDVSEEISVKLCADSRATSVLLVPVQSLGMSYGLMLLSADGGNLGSEDAQAFARVLGAQMGQALKFTQTFTALSASEERYRSLRDNANDAICVLSSDGVICEANRRLSDILGYPPEHFLGKRIVDFSVPGSERENELALQEHLASGETSSLLVSVQKEDGSNVVLDISNAVVEIADENVIFAILRDVTLQQQSREQLMISDRMATIGTLTAGVAHEINNPLAAVMANLDFAMKGLAALADRAGHSAEFATLQESLKEAQECSERVANIVKDVKMFSYAEEHKRVPVDVARVLDSTLRMAQNEIIHRARVVRDYGPVPLVDANESRLGQVFLNLVINAAQAIPDGHADANEIHVATRTDSMGRATIEIRDSGTGMSNETLKKIFQPFFTTKPVGVGTGLGMAICQRILAECGGKIAAKSTLGVGTTFTITLMPSASQAEGKVVVPMQVAAPRRGQLLVIDDEPAVARAVERSLSQDHNVTRLTSATDALRLIAAGQQFDVIICDMMMPVVTGMSFYEELLRSAPKLAKRVVFLTGGAFTTEAREFLDRVPNLCIEKPFDVLSIRNLVNTMISQQTREERLDEKIGGGRLPL